MIYSSRVRLIAAIILVPFVGCASRVPPPLGGSTIGPIEKTAWVKSVKVSDPTLRDGQREALEDALIITLSDRILEGGYFSDVRTFPGSPAVDDLLVDLSFTGYHGVRGLHPAYVPGAFLTLTLWIWFGGPIFTEDVDYSGQLTVRASDEHILCESRGEQRRQRNMNLYSENYLNADTTPDRDAAIKDMLDAAVNCLQREGLGK